MPPVKPPTRSETEAPDLELPAPVRKFELRVIEGSDAGARYVGNGERMVVGTDASADLRLSDPTVSRRHCELVLASGSSVRWSLVDVLERQGVATARIARLELIHDESRTAKLAWGPIDFAFHPTASGEVMLGAQALPANSIALFTRS